MKRTLLLAIIAQATLTSAPARFTDKPIAITPAECTAAKIGDAVPASAIGETVSSVALSEPKWVPAAGPLPARCEVDGRILPVDQAARAISFRVWLPAEWNRRAAQQGGGGMNGTIPDLRGAGYPIDGRTPAQLGFVTYGSDSGHQLRDAPDWALNDEAVRNLGYMQLKKTHDAAMAIVMRVYGERPRYSYFTGTSQGGREALTVAQRYPNDYDGVVANVPIVSFSSLMLGPELIRIHEKPIANWVTRAKVNAIRAEFLRQCDGLDGTTDGVIDNYMACRAIFDLTQGAPNRHPWSAKRCPNNVDPDPADASPKACLTDGQISTLELVYSRYRFATPLANGLRTFGMWVPNTDPSGSGLIVDARFKGQEGATADAPAHTHLGVLGVTGFLMRDLAANPLDYQEGGPLNRRREELSAILDSANPDLRPFAQRGGRMIVTIGTNDTLASPGSQLDYYQSVIDTMGRRAVDEFARLFVIPQANHGLMASTADIDGTGRTVPRTLLPTAYERFAVLVDWVEQHKAPAMALTVTGEGGRSRPLCSYPSYPRASGGCATDAQPPPSFVSPQVNPDRTLTLRLFAPGAVKVSAAGELDGQPHAMTKGSDGVWTVTIGPLAPDIYTYAFDVDGVTALDPRNANTKYGYGAFGAVSVVEVPGDAPQFYDMQNVPHGDVRIRPYMSKALGVSRTAWVYTPPGYDQGASYPVLYLLHGAGDIESGWTMIGRANTILDNLIAQKKARPMVVVMPLGHTIQSFWTGPAKTVPDAVSDTMAKGASLEEIIATMMSGDGKGGLSPFARDLVEDVMPMVESSYKVSRRPDDRALAGLSMGGGQSINLAFAKPELYRYVVLMSPAASGRVGQYYANVLKNPAMVNKQFKLFWIGVGKDDTLTGPGDKDFVAALKTAGVTHTFVLSTDGTSGRCGVTTSTTSRRYCFDDVCPDGADS